MKKSLFIVGIIALIFISPKVYGYVRGCQNPCPVNQSQYNNCGNSNCTVIDCPRNADHNQEMNHCRNRHHSSHHRN